MNPLSAKPTRVPVVVSPIPYVPTLPTTNTIPTYKALDTYIRQGDMAIS